MNKYQTGISPVHVTRAEDLPYFDSPPIQFVYSSTAPLLGGMYTWTDAPSALLVNRPVMANALYFFRSISFIADIDEGDFEAAIGTVPQFQTYLRGDAQAVLFREPVLMCKYFNQFDYRFWFRRGKVNEQLLCSFQGILIQTAALIGKTSITLRAVISAQEITDENFIKNFVLHYPDISGGSL